MRRALFAQGLLLVVLIAGIVVYTYTIWGNTPTLYQWDDTRDLSSPSGRLVGHWEMISEVERDVQQLYFGALDAEGKGQTFLVLANGVVKEMEYRVTREVRSGLQLEFDCLSPGGKLIRSVVMSLAEDGQGASYSFTYHDQVQKRHLRYRGPQVKP